MPKGYLVKHLLSVDTAKLDHMNSRECKTLCRERGIQNFMLNI